MSSIVSFNRRCLNLLNDTIALSYWFQSDYQSLQPTRVDVATYVYESFAKDGRKMKILC